MPLDGAIKVSLVRHHSGGGINHLRSPCLTGVDAFPECKSVWWFPSDLGSMGLACAVFQSVENYFVSNLVLNMRLPRIRTGYRYCYLGGVVTFVEIIGSGGRFDYTCNPND